MNLKNACQYVAARFVYKKDRGEDWKVLSGDKMEGDCEDYSLTVMSLYFGGIINMLRAMFNGKAKMWFAKTQTGELHWVGQIGDWYFDNWTFEPLKKEEFVQKTAHQFIRSRGCFFAMIKLSGKWFYLGLALVVGGTVLGILKILN